MKYRRSPDSSRVNKPWRLTPPILVIAPCERPNAAWRASTIPAVLQPSAAISLHNSRIVSEYTGRNGISDQEPGMTAPKTLLELSGAGLRPPRLRHAALVMIDLQN